MHTHLCIWCQRIHHSGCLYFRTYLFWSIVSLFSFLHEDSLNTLIPSSPPPPPPFSFSPHHTHTHTHTQTPPKSPMLYNSFDWSRKQTNQYINAIPEKIDNAAIFWVRTSGARGEDHQFNSWLKNLLINFGKDWMGGAYILMGPGLLSKLALQCKTKPCEH